MKKIMYRLILLLVFLFEINTTVVAQWYLDTATAEEAKLHDQFYIILQKEIESKICNSDWGIPANPFLLLKDDPYKMVVLRGKSINYFGFTGFGEACTIRLKETSPLFKANQDSLHVLAKIQEKQWAIGKSIMERTAKNNFKVSAADQKTMDSIKPIGRVMDLKSSALFEETLFGDISMHINKDWTSDFERTNKYRLLPTVPGVRYAILRITYPDKDRTDTSYSVLLYIGNWPQIDMKKRVNFPFKHYTKYAWIDRQHSGPPVVENLGILVSSHYYNNVMKMIHDIDWTKLTALVKQ
jgi:hypothetical protein